MNAIHIETFRRSLNNPQIENIRACGILDGPVEQAACGHNTE